MEQRGDGADDEEGGGGATPGELLAFVRSAPKRRRRLAILAFVLTAIGGLAASVLKPPAYIAEVKIVAQRNETLKEVATKSKSDESPTKGAPESILRRDNVLAVMSDVKLVERWDADRPPVMRIKDRVTRLISKPPSDEDKIRAIVGILEKKVLVAADDTTITITMEWPNAETSYELVTAFQERFLRDRQRAEVGMITDAIAILESHLKTEREKLDEAVAELQRLEDLKKKGTETIADAGVADAAAPAPAVRRPRVPRPAGAPQEDPEMRKAVDDKERQIASLEADHQRRLADLNGQLTTLKATLAPAHPSIVALEFQLEQAKQTPPEITRLKGEVAALESELAAQRAAPADTARTYDPAPTNPADRPDAGGALITILERQDDDAATALAKQRLTNATLKYDELQSSIRAARIELDVAEAAFKYKYSILTPAEVPKDPKKPSPMLIAIAGIVAAFLFYFLIPAIADLLSGKMIAAWQAKKLGIPLLGEVEPPDA